MEKFCNLCNVPLNEEEPNHNGSDYHRFNFLLFEWAQYRKALVKNRHGIEVSIAVDKQNGFVYKYSEYPKKGKHLLQITPAEMLAHKNTLSFICKIKNCRNKDSIIVTGATPLHQYPLYSLHDPSGHLDDGKFLEIEAGGEYAVVVKFATEEDVLIGTFKIHVSFNLQTVEETPRPFSIARSIVISVQESDEEVEPTVKSPFTGEGWPPNVEIFPPTKMPIYSDMFGIPRDIMNILRHGLVNFKGMTQEDYALLYELSQKMAPGYLTAQNYVDYWHIVLWLEETGQRLGLQRYNMENVQIKLIGSGDMLELEVPGLAEKRPSVITGDMIDLKVHNDMNRGYRGIIKRVNDKTVHIGNVDEEFIDYVRLVPTIEVDVKFVIGRLPCERQHKGVEQVVQNGMVPALFGEHRFKGPERPRYNIQRYFNPLIETNHEQKTAVGRILSASSRSLPYIVFGPPGTGKTITIVEAILQLKLHTKCKILVCAPANAACDMLTEKLLPYCTKTELIRIMSENVDVSICQQSVLQYSNYQQNGAFAKISYEELNQYRIVVTTLILVGRYNRKYHPDVVFIDEAAQACEPEATCAISMLEAGNQIVLAGDPKQLGPSLSSRVSEKYGLGISLLERLMGLDVYKNENTNYITMLKLNFRSNSTILKLPNELFYGGQLMAVSARSHNDPLSYVHVYQHIQDDFRQKTRGVPTMGQAIEFCSVISKESRQGRSPSYFNVKELNMVLKYVQTLLNLRFPNPANNVMQEHIGIVTPYARQVQKVKAKLREHRLENVVVGTTETFQGREKRIIIITTVRAQADLLLYDKKYNLGFVKHEKRFNVALTRAMSKLIIIGCPHVLATDSKWLQYIEMCEGLNAYCGAPFSRRDKEAIRDITRRLDNVNFVDKQHDH